MNDEMTASEKIKMAIFCILAFGLSGSLIFLLYYLWFEHGFITAIAFFIFGIPPICGIAAFLFNFLLPEDSREKF